MYMNNKNKIKHMIKSTQDSKLNTLHLLAIIGNYEALWV